jgi:hypothetical protein
VAEIHASVAAVQAKTGLKELLHLCWLLLRPNFTHHHHLRLLLAAANSKERLLDSVEDFKRILFIRLLNRTASIGGIDSLRRVCSNKVKTADTKKSWTRNWQQLYHNGIPLI